MFFKGFLKIAKVIKMPKPPKLKMEVTGTLPSKNPNALINSGGTCGYWGGNAG